MRPGLCSITFRNLSVEEIVDLVARGGLEVIEWGGDVHVPHGDLPAAERARQLTEDAGLAISSYGSYYKLGDPEGSDFEAVLESTLALGVSTLRIWSGSPDSANIDEDTRKARIDETREIAAQAEAHGISIGFEFHGGCLTDTPEASTAFMREIDRNNVGMYWQPALEVAVADRVAGLASMLPWLKNIHMFTWAGENGAERYPLVDGQDDWSQYLATAGADDRDGAILLEYVMNDDPEQFVADAATLRSWTEGW